MCCCLHLPPSTVWQQLVSFLAPGVHPHDPSCWYSIACLWRSSSPWWGHLLHHGTWLLLLAARSYPSPEGCLPVCTCLHIFGYISSDLSTSVDFYFLSTKSSFKSKWDYCCLFFKIFETTINRTEVIVEAASRKPK